MSLDNATVYRDIVGGVNLKFSSSLSFANTWQTEIRIGHSFGPVAAFGASAGQPGDSIKIRVRNEQGDEEEPEAAQNVRAVVARHAKLYPTSGVVFEKFFDFAASGVEKITDGHVQPYAVTVESKSGSGASKTGDIKFEGDLVNVRNKTNNAEGTSEDLNVVDIYEVTDGNLEGIEFQLAQLVTNAATANVTQTAPDLGGAPGDWGNVDVFITSDGEDEGVIAPGSFGYIRSTKRTARTIFWTTRRPGA